MAPRNDPGLDWPSLLKGETSHSWTGPLALWFSGLTPLQALLAAWPIWQPCHDLGPKHESASLGRWSTQCGRNPLWASPWLELLLGRGSGSGCHANAPFVPPLHVTEVPKLLTQPTSLECPSQCGSLDHVADAVNMIGCQTLIDDHTHMPKVWVPVKQPQDTDEKWGLAIP
jgi:hypothetical protein